MKKIFFRTALLAVAVGIVMQTASCGTLLHPERKGQKDGRLDTTIVILDACGFLFGIIPGVIAFAVDLSNGTIYLPPGQSSFNDVEKSELIAIKCDDMSKEGIEKALSSYLGREVDLDGKDAVLCNFDTLEEGMQAAK